MYLFAKINYIKERIGYKYLVLYFNYCKIVLEHEKFIIRIDKKILDTNEPHSNLIVFHI